MFRHRIFFIVFFCIAFSAYAATVRAEKLVIYGDQAYPPVIYLEQSKALGILPIILARLSKDTGDTYEFRLLPWKRALNESLQGHGAIVGISLNKEREELYDFSESIYNDDLQLVVLKGHEFNFSTLKDLKGKSVGGAFGASYGEAIDHAIAEGVIAMERDPNQFSRLRKLLAGRMDVAIIGNGNAGLQQLLASDPELAVNAGKFVVLPHPLASDPLYLAFAKTMHMKAALARFNKALSAFKKTDEYHKLIAGKGN